MTTAAIPGPGKLGSDAEVGVHEGPAHQILERVGEATHVGGQEDMIIDVTVELAGHRSEEISA
ncbi:hypothetical protein O4328_28525 [Rhodococcus opacus]|uniref:DmpG-like communication domain-containing protein n=1 Tax=Rhodococcus opacus TaxID=37919 RepID=A0ABT4NJM5_RHOOP|nr:hypothetical protein [Rhodococcus opacus]MCZ4587586.1 hypothetical protein [Rhodococcus opacus]